MYGSGELFVEMSSWRASCASSSGARSGTWRGPYGAVQVQYQYNGSSRCSRLVGFLNPNPRLVGSRNHVCAGNAAEAYSA
eukprot:5645657-Pyramimonas_sp.AAC.2